jgi:hypothetical protein
MASHARVNSVKRQKSPSPRRSSSEISEGTAVLSPEIFGVRSALRVLRSDDTVPYCARLRLLIRSRIKQNFFQNFSLIFVRNLSHAGADH